MGANVAQLIPINGGRLGFGGGVGWGASGVETANRRPARGADGAPRISLGLPVGLRVF